MRSLAPALAAALCLTAAAAGAQQPEQVSDEQVSDEQAAPLRVSVTSFAPFVMLEGEQATGYSVELWQLIAERMGAAYRWVPAPGVVEQIRHLEQGQADVAIGGLTLTRQRELTIDFTHPTYESGLGLLVRSQEQEVGYLERVFRAASKTNSGIIFGFLLLIVLAGHLVWIAEKGADMFSDRYLPGVFEGMYWAIVTASTVGYGDKAPVQWAGRAVAAFVIVASLPLFALFTAELTSALTLTDLQTEIAGVDDLKRRPVAVREGTTGATWAAERGLVTRPFDDMGAAYEALFAGEVDAVIHDAPHLMYFAQNEGSGRAVMAGGIVQPQDLGMAVPEQSPLREMINRTLLELGEEGELARLKAQWFGSTQ